MKRSTLFLSPALLLISSLFLGSCNSETPSTEVGADATSAPPAEATETKVEHVDAEQAAVLLASDAPPVVIDVRTPEEFAEGHLEGAKSIDFKGADFETQLAELSPDQAYLVHCAVGGRSTGSLETFKKLGFSHVIHLDGGFNGWQAAGKPVVK